MIYKIPYWYFLRDPRDSDTITVTGRPLTALENVLRWHNPLILSSHSHPINGTIKYPLVGANLLSTGWDTRTGWGQISLGNISRNCHPITAINRGRDYLVGCLQNFVRSAVQPPEGYIYQCHVRFTPQSSYLDTIRSNKPPADMSQIYGIFKLIIEYHTYNISRSRFWHRIWTYTPPSQHICFK